MKSPWTLSSWEDPTSRKTRHGGITAALDQVCGCPWLSLHPCNCGGVSAEVSQGSCGERQSQEAEGTRPGKEAPGKEQHEGEEREEFKPSEYVLFPSLKEASGGIITLLAKSQIRWYI